MSKLPAENANRSTDRADVVDDAGPVVTWLRSHPLVVDSVGAMFSVVFGLAMTVLTPLLIVASVLGGFWIMLVQMDRIVTEQAAERAAKSQTHDVRGASPSRSSSPGTGTPSSPTK